MVHLDLRTVFHYVQEARRVLRPKGVLVLHVATSETSKGWSHLVDSVMRRVTKGQFGSFEYLDDATIRRIAAHTGFSVAKKSSEESVNFYYSRDMVFALMRDET
jgi:hypothetical protein